MSFSVFPLRKQVEEYKKLKYFWIDINEAFFNSKIPLDLWIDTKEIYKKIRWKVWDLMWLDFIRDWWVNLVTSNDVFEHVPDPKKAYKEISRILKKWWYAVITLPANYKLDQFNLEHMEKRKSSHLTKQFYWQWDEFSKWTDLELVKDKIRPLWIWSGILYYSWLDDSYFLPQKHKNSLNKNLFKELKKIISNLDNKLDKYFLENNWENANKIINYLQNWDIKNAIFSLLKIVKENFSSSLEKEEIEKIEEFENTLKNADFKWKENEIKDIFKKEENPLYLLANSIIMVYKKN